MCLIAMLLVVGMMGVPRQGLAAPEGSVEVRDGWFRTSDGVRLHYLVGGYGPTIIFVPGWTMPAQIWQPQLRHFVSSSRVVALDPRSQGRSDRPNDGNFVERRAMDIQELLVHLGDKTAVLVGWSLGVHEVLQLVEQSGTERLAGIVLVDDFIWTTPESGRAAYFESSLERLLRDRPAFTVEFVRGMYRRPQEAEYLHGIVEASLLTPTPTAYTLLAGAYVLGRRDWRPALRRIDRPLLYVASTATTADAEEVLKVVPGAEVETFADAGHALFVDDAVRFNRVLESFLRKIRASPR